MKCGALGLLEAAERLLEDGFRPSGDVYFALGHDEEVGGNEGNRRVAEILRSRGVRFRFVLDEGGGLTEGIIAIRKNRWDGPCSYASPLLGV